MARADGSVAAAVGWAYGLVPPYMTMAMRISRFVPATRCPPFARVWVLTTTTPKAWVGGILARACPEASCRAAVGSRVRRLAGALPTPAKGSEALEFDTWKDRCR